MVFVHAGILPEHITENNKDNFILKINHLMKLFLRGNKTHHDSEIQNYFLNKNSMIWNRNYGKEDVSCENIELVNNALNVGHMIVGHSIQPNINQKCSHKLWRIDVGMSGAFENDYDTNYEVLEILNDGVPCIENNYKPFRILK